MTELTAQVAALFDAPVGVAAADPRQPQPDLLPQEAPHVRCAILKRQREFAAGRAAARQAMTALAGGPINLAIPAAQDRSPIWPDGWQGSITHKTALCLAVVGRSGALLGLDVEEDTPLNPDLIPTICTAQEIAAMDAETLASVAKLVFSAKEAAYKAQYALTRQVFGFHRFIVTLDLDRESFTARFTEDTGVFVAGDQLEGQFCRAEGHLVTAVTIGQATVGGMEARAT